VDVSTSYSFSTYVAGYQHRDVGNVTSRSVNGLNASTRYYYRVRAYNGAGTSDNSNIKNVTTLRPTGPPKVVTNAATNRTASSARLNGSVDPHGHPTTVIFQWGTTMFYGHRTPDQTMTGNSYLNVYANITGLTANTTYHLRIRATKMEGTKNGLKRKFTTLAAQNTTPTPRIHIRTRRTLWKVQLTPHPLNRQHQNAIKTNTQ
jgi:hypothetical protein